MVHRVSSWVKIMQNIKNFTLNEAPTARQLKDAAPGSYFFTSEDGQDWYECRKLFSDNTIKIAYLPSGVIVQAVTKPVPQMGNKLAIEAMHPEGRSVAEVESVPHDFAVDGTWKFDGEKVYRDTGTVDARTLKGNTSKRNSLVMEATTFISMIQCSAAVKKQRQGDTERLSDLCKYVDALRDVDLTIENPYWPQKPEWWK